MNKPNEDIREVLISASEKRDYRAKLLRYRGELRVDVRQYAEKNGARIPTPKGVSLPVTKLPVFIDALQTLQLAAAEQAALVQP